MLLPPQEKRARLRARPGTRGGGSAGTLGIAGHFGIDCDKQTESGDARSSILINQLLSISSAGCAEMSQDGSQIDVPDFIPASMIAAFAYCPRLCYLQWVEGEFQESAEIADGRLQHRWVDGSQDPVPEDFLSISEKMWPH